VIIPAARHTQNFEFIALENPKTGFTIPLESMNAFSDVILSEATLAPHVICLANHAGENLYDNIRDSSFASAHSE